MQAVEPRPRHAEDLGGARLVAARRFEHAQHVLPLDLVERRHVAPSRRAREANREVLGADHAAGRDDDGAHQAVLELADVAGPVCSHQASERRGRQHRRGDEPSDSAARCTNVLGQQRDVVARSRSGGRTISTTRSR